jgi:actin-related protein
VEADRSTVVLSEPVNNPKENRTTLAEVLFEVFGVRSIFLGSSPSLALYISCKTEGVVLDVGDSFAQVASIFEWSQLPATLLRTEVAGQTVREFFQKSMKDLGYTAFSGPNGLSCAENCIKSQGFVALDYAESLKSEVGNTVEYNVTPDAVIKLGVERFKCPEVLFQPNLDNIKGYGASELLFESIMRADIGLRPSLLGNVVLSGGITLLNGFEERVKHDLQNLFPDSSVSVLCPAARESSVWIGGSILGALSLFGQMVVTRDEYHESGETAIRRRFY